MWACFWTGYLPPPGPPPLFVLEFVPIETGALDVTTGQAADVAVKRATDVTVGSQGSIGA